MKLKFVLFLLLFISQISYSQIVTTVFDSAGVNLRDDIVLDKDGNIYCSDYGGSNIYKLSTTGILTVFAGGLNTPNGMAFDSNNNLFVCDNVGDRIYKLGPSGAFLDTIVADKPSGLIKEFDSDTLIFTEYGTAHRLNKLSPDGIITPMHSGPPLNGPVGLAYDNSGQLYAANFNDRKVFKVDDDTVVYLATMPGPNSGAIGFLAFGGGYLWATSFNGHKIYGISTTAIDSTFIYAGSTPGGVDGPLDTATFSTPNGIYSNGNGDTMYISEYNSGKLRRITTSTIGISEEKLTNANAISLSLYPNPSKGKIFFENHSGNRIREVKIINSQGKTIRIVRPKADSMDIKIEKEGIYFAKINFENNTEITKTILIIKD